MSEHIQVWLHTWQTRARLHSVRFLPITEPTDVETQRPDIIDALGHNQVLVHQVATVGARLEQNMEAERNYMRRRF